MCGGGSGSNSTQTVVQQQNLPQWYQDYMQNVIGRATSQSAGQAPIYGQVPTAPGAAPTPPDASLQNSDPTAYAKQQTQYQQDLANYQGQQTAFQNYQSMTPAQQSAYGQRNAGMTDQQLQAQQGISSMQGAETPYLNQAAQGYQTALNDSQSIWSPGFDQALGYGQNAADIGQNVLASSSPYFGAGANAIGSSIQGAQEISGAQQPYLNQAQSMIGQGANSNLVGMASPYINSAVQQPMGLTAAAPFLQNASQSLPQATMDNLNPYLGGAMNSLSTQAAYDLQNKYLPAVNDSFIHAGQFGSTRNQDITAQTIHDTSQNVLNQQSQLLNQAYGQAGQLAESNLGLQGQLGQIAGGLGTAQQQALLGAGSTLGTLGGAQAGLQLQGAGQYAGLGSQAANAQAQQAQIGIGGGSALGNLAAQQGQLGLGVGQLDLGAGQLANSVASSRGNLALGASQAANNAATGLTNYANTAQGMNLAQNNALYSSGAQTQNLNQQNLNTAYQDWLNQTFYGQNQTSWLSNIVRGLPSTGIGQTTNYTTPTNTGAQIGGLLTAGLGAAGAAGAGGAGQAVTGPVTGYFRGGGVKFKRGGRVAFKNGSNDNAPLRGIGHFRQVA